MVALAEPAGALWTAAAADVARAAARVGPRGRMRLHHALSTLRATTLVATPTGAMDLLSRLHLEFLLDPLDLGLRTIVLTGEIASKRTLGHLAGEFGATVTEVLASPFGGGALAWRAAEEDPLRPLADGVLGLAALDKDVPATADGPAELVVTPSAHSTLGDAVLRTGLVARTAGAGDIPAPAHTVGEHVLVRACGWRCRGSRRRCRGSTACRDGSWRSAGRERWTRRCSGSRSPGGAWSATPCGRGGSSRPSGR
ncbi:hypothetical protein ACFQ0B_72620 [Nonomuraea thailandensis]